MCVSNGFLLGRGSTAAGVRVFRNRSFVSVCWFFAWHGLESCWCFGLFESDADENLSSHRSESTLLLVVIYVRFERAISAPFLVYESCSSGPDPAGVSVFSDLLLTKL